MEGCVGSDDVLSCGVEETQEGLLGSCGSGELGTAGLHGIAELLVVRPAPFDGVL